MLNLLKGELFKLKKSTGFRVVMVITVIVGIFEFASFVSSDGMLVRGYDAFYTQFSDYRTLIFVLAGAFSGIFIGEDFACRAYQAEIASGNSRFTVLLSKSLVYMLGLCLMISVQMIIVTAGVTFINGFGEILSLAIIGNMFRAGLMFMFHVCSSSMLCVFTAIILKNKGSILAVNFLLLVVIDGMFQLASSVSDKALEAYIRTPFLQSLISASPTISRTELIQSCIIGLAAIGVLYSLSYAVFRRCELK